MRYVNHGPWDDDKWRRVPGTPMGIGLTWDANENVIPLDVWMIPADEYDTIRGELEAIQACMFK